MIVFLKTRFGLRHISRVHRGIGISVADENAHRNCDIAAAGTAGHAIEPETQVVGIDEGQFFDAELPAVCNRLADMGKRVIVAGLDKDYLGRPFEPMPQLLAIAEYITKTLAICMVCGNPANHTQRLVPGGDRVLLGAQGTYEARCRACFDPELARAAATGESSTLESRIPNRESPKR